VPGAVGGLGDSMTTNEKTSAALTMIEEGLSNLGSSENWAAYLRTQSRFHRYSFNNTLLILMQAPEATKVAGYRTWLSLGRQVRKGEHGIKILAPAMYRTKNENESDEDGEPSETRQLRGFTTATVFDIAQTDGDEIPEPVATLTGSGPEGALESLLAVAAARGVAVEIAPIPSHPGAHGVFQPSANTITLRPDLSGAQMVKTLSHELAHADLHRDGVTGDVDRSLCELEAESVAFIVCQHLGVDSSEYSFGYLANWAGNDTDRAAKLLRELGGRVAGAAKRIIETLESTSGAETVAA